MIENQNLSENLAAHLMRDITEKLDKKDKSLAIFLDLAKAFDTVSHKRLLEKLYSLGIRGAPLELFRNYQQIATPFFKK